MEHFCEIIFKSINLSKRRCHLKVVFFYFSSGAHFYSVERNHFSNFGRGSPKEHF